MGANLSAIEMLGKTPVFIIKDLNTDPEKKAFYPKRAVGFFQFLNGVDIIVNFTGRNLDLASGGAISRAINELGGSRIQQELNDSYPNGLKTGEIAITEAYGLPYKFVYHCALQGINQRVSYHLLREIIYKVLETAKDKHPESSIVFPAIGTGSMKFPFLVLRTIYCTILDFMNKHERTIKDAFILVHPRQQEQIEYLKKINPMDELDRLTYKVEFPSEWTQSDEIRPVLYESDDEYNYVTEKYEETIKKTFEIVRNNSRIKSSGESPLRIIKDSKTDPQKKAFYPKRAVGYFENIKDVDIIVNSTGRNLDLASGGAISQTINELGGSQIQQELNDSYPNGIETGEFAITAGYNLPYKYVYHCSLEGIKQNVSYHLLREIIYKCLETVRNQHPKSTIVFPAIGTGSLNFPPRVLRTIYCTIMEFMHKYPGAIKDAFILITPNNEKHIEYLEKINPSEELDRLTYKVNFPSCWSRGDEIRRVPLPNSNNEYKDAIEKFGETIEKTCEIVRVERIENKRLFTYYKRFEKLHPEYKELNVWHGTNEATIDSIIRYGFDWRLNKRGLYGQGCYFAVNASYSDNDLYSDPNDNGEKHMFLCNILIGEYIEGNKEIDENNIGEYIQDETQRDEFDILSKIPATVDKVENPSIYVTYNDDQMYPAYLIVYKSSESN